MSAGADTMQPSYTGRTDLMDSVSDKWANSIRRRVEPIFHPSSRRHAVNAAYEGIKQTNNNVY